MDFIEVNGTALRYELDGSGIHSMVLIHEMGGSLESWDLVAPRLADGRRVLRYDTRGAGLSEKLRGDLSIDTMVADLMALLDALKIAGGWRWSERQWGERSRSPARRAFRSVSQRSWPAALRRALPQIAVPRSWHASSAWSMLVCAR